MTPAYPRGDWRHLTVAAVMGLCGAPGNAGAQRPESALVGRWELNLPRSHYGGGADPRSRESLVCEPAKGAIRCTTTSVRSEGRHTTAVFTAREDGTPARVRELEGVDEVSLMRVDAFIADATFRYRGQPVFAYRAVRAADGRSLTIIAVDPVSRAVLHSVVVYDAR